MEVRAAAVRVRGQGLVVKTTKTDAGTLVLPRWCVAMLRDRAARRTATTDDRAGRPVFPAPWVDGAIPPTPRPTCGTPSPPPASTGSPRMSSAKTVATLMDQAGLSSRAAADQLGHANTSMTTDVYFGRKVAATGAAAVLEALSTWVAASCGRFQGRRP